MFARHRPDGKQPIFHRLQIRRAERQGLDRPLDALLRLPQLGHRPPQCRQNRLQLAVGLVGGAADTAHCVGQHALGTLMAHGVMGPGKVIADAGGALHQPAFGIEAGLFARLRVEFAQLRHGMAQEVFLAPDLGQPGLGQRQSLARV